MAAAVFQVQQFIGVVFYEQGEFFCQRHWLGKVADNILNIRFFLFSAHGSLLSGERMQGLYYIIGQRLTSTFK